MPLRSMRHEYYNVARKYGLGFAGVCIECSPHVALARNSLRSTPIPESTVRAMAETLEPPDHAQHHWERGCVSLKNDDTNKQRFIAEGCEHILRLVEEALKSPVPPVEQIDTALQEEGRIANLTSNVHQADILMRKCVTSVLQDPQPGEFSKAVLARKANLVRKEILAKVRSGTVTYDDNRWDVSTLDNEHFKAIISKIFHTSFALQLTSDL